MLITPSIENQWKLSYTYIRCLYMAMYAHVYEIFIFFHENKVYAIK